MENKLNLKQKWNMFLSIVLSPGSAIFLVVAIVCLYLSYIKSGEQSLSNILAVLASISAAVAGTFLKDDWNKMQEGSLLEKKGLSAIRNLESIEKQIIQIRKWIKSFSKKKITKRELEEIDRHLSTTEMNIESGLLDWIDVSPELQEREREMKIYQKTTKAYINEWLRSKKELIEIKENKKSKKQLEKKIKELEKEMENLREKQYLIKSDFDGSPLDNYTASLISNSSHLEAISSFNNKICSNCGMSYKDDSPCSLATISNTNLCPACIKLKKI